MDRKMLRDDQWAHMEHLLPDKASDPGCTAQDNRRFVETILWIMRTGNLHAEFGYWHRTYVRFSRWWVTGVRARVAIALRGDADMEHLLLDSTIVRAHQHSAGAQKSGKSGNRPIAGWTDDQAACGRRRPGQSVARHSLGRAGLDLRRPGFTVQSVDGVVAVAGCYSSVHRGCTKKWTGRSPSIE